MGLIPSITQPIGGIFGPAQPVEPEKQESAGKAFKAGAGIAALPDGVENVAEQGNPLISDPKPASADEGQPNLPTKAAAGIGAVLGGMVGDVAETVGGMMVSAGKGIVNGVKRFFGGLFG